MTVVYGETKEQMIDRKRQARMSAIDNLSKEHRELVHEYGLTVVHALMQCGVTKPNKIRHCVETILNEFSPTRGSYAAQGPRKDVNTGLLFAGKSEAA